MDNVRVNAKSIMGMMNLALLNGASVTIEAEGADEEDAVTEIQRFLTRR
jgi:catabolite repression HPr-like protein